MPDADKEDALSSQIMRDGKDVLRQRPDPAGPAHRKSERPCWQTGSTRRVFMRADARAKLRRRGGSGGQRRSAGVDQLGLLTDQKKKTRAPQHRRAGQ